MSRRLRPLGRVRKATGLLALSVILGGCGPHVPLEVSVRQVPVDIILGLQKVQRAITHALPSFPPGVNFGGPFGSNGGGAQPAAPAVTAGARPGITPSSSPLPCPVANLLTTFPDQAASSELMGTPQPGVYPFRNGGSYQPDTSTTAGVVKFPADATWTVSKARPLAQDIFDFDVVNSAAGKAGTTTTTTTFRVVPHNVTEGTFGGVTATQAAGVYITAITSKPNDGPFFTFNPQPMITYLNLPVTFGISWDTSGSDPASGLTLKLHGAIDDSLPGTNKGRRVVDACGTLIDTWEVVATGSLVGRTEKLDIATAYDVATQYGGMTFSQLFDYGGPDTTPVSPITAHSRNLAVSSALTPKPK
ncbi:MAG: hypothetical protein ABR573_00770 [Candidatus Dormibacteria bacterium]